MSNDVKCIVVLNYSRNKKYVQWFFDLYDKMEELEVNDYVFMYVTKDECVESMCDITLCVGECNIATMKNKVIDECVNRGYMNLHMIDDDIVITDISIFDKYQELSKFTGSSFINNGYTTNINYTLIKRNPRLLFNIGKYKGDTEFNEIIMNAHISTGYSYYDLSVIGSVRYDENLTHLENIEYIPKLHKLGHIPFLNFFVDLSDSYKYINRVVNQQNKSNEIQNEIDTDKKYLSDNNIKWETQNNIDNVIDHYTDRFKNTEVT